MPTTEQLFMLMEADLEFGLRESEYNVRGSSNASSRRPVTKFTGKHIGYIVYDKYTRELNIIREEKAE